MIGTIQFLILLMEDEGGDLHIKMLESLSKKETRWKKNICETISKLSHIDYRIIKLLKELAYEDAWQVRREVSNCFGGIRIERSRLMDLLNQRSKDEYVKVRITTAWSLGKIWVKYPKEYTLIIAKMSNDKNINVKKYYKKVLLQILDEIEKVKPDETFPILGKMAGDESWNIRKAALEAFIHVVTVKPDETLQILKELAGDSDWNALMTVVYALREFGKVRPDKVLPILKELAGNSVRVVRWAVADALEEISKVKSDETLPVLREWSEDGDRYIRWAAENAL